MAGVPLMPRFPGAERFKGEQYHSSAHRTGEKLARASVAS
jgi:cation diffusion facilitator CzcD-associated flavoprotein CzcO